MNKRGFTLVEIIVAMTIFSLVFLPLVAVLVAESKFERSYERKQVALMVAKNEIELVKKQRRNVEADDYNVENAGRRWRVERSVDAAEASLMPDSAKLELCVVRIKVFGEKDTASLADLSVLKETYQ
jgi:type II secretion system protein I